MPDLPSRLRRFIFPLLFAAIQFGFTKTLSAQAPAPTQPSADLEKRVHELEDTVRRLETERSSPATATNSTSPQLSTNQDASGSFAQTHDPSQPESPSGDTYFLLQARDRELLVPDAPRRRALWTPRVWPGAVLVAGEIVGIWRRGLGTVTIQAWRRLTRAARDAVEAEVASLPLPDLRGRLVVRWED